MECLRSGEGEGLALAAVDHEILDLLGRSEAGGQQLCADASQLECKESVGL